jgi:multiple inositol-polyphosphate phosphatase/2,3-bisphosphoglycerate 3-phosphatase
MNRLLILLSIAAAVSFSRNIVSSPGGSKTVYTPEDTTNTLAPAGYVPYYINYVGRHGARHVTSLQELSRLDHFLQGAENSGNLTAEGDTLYARVDRLLSVEKKYTPGDLTQRGREEQYGIGRRMVLHYPSVFSGSKYYLNISWTEEQRTRQSLNAFMRAIPPPVVEPPMSMDSVHLRFFDLSPAYKTFAKNGPWTKDLDRMLQYPAYQAQLGVLVRRFFVPAYAEKLLADSSAGEVTDARTSDATEADATVAGAKASDATKGVKMTKDPKKSIAGAQAFSEAVYGAAAITAGLKQEILASGWTPQAVDIFSLFSPREAKWLALVGGVKDFLVKGPGMDPDGIQVRNAVPLLIDLLQTTDSSIRHHAGGADLRFAHAETIAPLASLLELEGAVTPTKDLLQYPQIWKVEHIMPFSANIQWILYHADAGGKDSAGAKAPSAAPVLIKVLYNEKPVHLPVATNDFPYYRWEDVRRYYEAKLARIGVRPGQDMYRYLLELK